eukprot:2640847-Prymnesium_polylepis.1
MAPCARLQFFPHSARTDRAKGVKSGRVPRAPQAGVAVPDGPACKSPPPCVMLALLARHERRIPHCPPSP